MIEGKIIRETDQYIMGECARLRLDIMITVDDDNMTQYVTGGLKGLVAKHFGGVKLLKGQGMHKDRT